MIQLDCECGRTFQAPDSRAGRPVECPGCGLKFIAPAVRQVDQPDISPEESREHLRKLLSGIIKDVLWWVVLLPFKLAFGIVNWLIINPKGTIAIIVIVMVTYALMTAKK